MQRPDGKAPTVVFEIEGRHFMVLKGGLPWPCPACPNGPETAGSQRAMAAMMKMRKLDINVLQRAYDGA